MSERASSEPLRTSPRARLQASCPDRDFAAADPRASVRPWDRSSGAEADSLSGAETLSPSAEGETLPVTPALPPGATLETAMASTPEPGSAAQETRLLPGPLTMGLPGSGVASSTPPYEVGPSSVAAAWGSSTEGFRRALAGPWR
jgi:hypothetical protein